jgi:hypothetical protein
VKLLGDTSSYELLFIAPKMVLGIAFPNCGCAPGLVASNCKVNA